MEWNIEIYDFRFCHDKIKAGTLVFIFPEDKVKKTAIPFFREEDLGRILKNGGAPIGFGYLVDYEGSAYWRIMWRSFGEDTLLKALRADLEKQMANR